MTTPAVTAPDSAPAPDIVVDVSAEPQATQTEDINYSNRDELGRFVAKVADEQDTTRILESIAAKDSITIADLKALPEAAGYSDAELQALWDEVNGVGNKAVEPPKPPAAPRGWKTYKGDVEVSDFSKMTVAEFLEAQHEYTANGKQHRKSLDEVFRNASQGHYNAQRMEQERRDKQLAYDKWQELEPKVQKYEQERQVWERSLAAASRGDFKPMEALLAAYVEALDAPATASEPAAAPQADPAAMQAGWTTYQTVVLPEADRIAREHGLPVKDVADGIMFLVDQEPAALFTRERLDQIVREDIPAYIAEMKRTAPAPVADTRDATIAELKAELDKLKGTKVDEHNKTVADVHRRRKNAPPAASSVPGNNAAEATGIKDAQSAREFLNNYRG